MMNRVRDHVVDHCLELRQERGAANWEVGLVMGSQMD